MGELQEIPDKPFFRTSEVCQLTDTQPYVLRFWESEFPQLAPDRSRGGPSVYRRRDIDIVLRIKKLLYEDEFTIDGARRQLERELAGEDLDRPDHDVAPEPRGPRAADAEPAGADVVPRGRYDDAVEEIELLRLRLREAEARERRAEARAQRADECAADDRRRIESALARIDHLLQSLAHPPAP